ncbi:nuclear transport factor 2 family protein [Cupriavidus necator]
MTTQGENSRRVTCLREYRRKRITDCANHRENPHPDTTTHLTWVAECERLCLDFAYFVDRRDYARAVALFTADGTFTRNGDTLHGPGAILQSMHARPAEIDTRHVCTNIRIDLGPDSTSARGTSYLTLYRGPKSGDGTVAATVVAEFDDRYQRTPGGWRIASRVVRFAF